MNVSLNKRPDRRQTRAMLAAILARHRSVPVRPNVYNPPITSGMSREQRSRQMALRRLALSTNLRAKAALQSIRWRAQNNLSNLARLLQARAVVRRAIWMHRLKKRGQTAALNNMRRHYNTRGKKRKWGVA